MTKTWKPTMNLRINYPSAGHVMQGAGVVQQQFICFPTGETEWRNVPYNFEYGSKTTGDTK